MPGVAETFRSVVEQMTYGMDFKIVNWLQAENVGPTHDDPNISIDESENW